METMAALPEKYGKMLSTSILYIYILYIYIYYIYIDISYDHYLVQ